MFEEIEGKLYTWSAQDVKQLCANEISLRSPTFSINLKTPITGFRPKIKCRLLLTTTVEQDVKDKISISQNSEKGHKRYIALYLQFMSEYFFNEPILKLNFSIWRPIYEAIFNKNKIILKVISRRHYGFSDFISIDELNKMKLEDLTIHCNFAIMEKDFKNSKNLLNNKSFSDVELNVNDEVIPAHKIVLALSSQFFRNKFIEQDSVTSIEIHDIEDKVFKKLLAYVYKGKVNLLNNIETRKLYLAALKYEIPDLEDNCLEKMEKNFTGEELIHTYMDLLKEDLDYSTSSRQLRILCIEIILENKRIIFEDYFQEFVQISPRFLVNIMESFFPISQTSTPEWVIKMNKEANLTGFSFVLQLYPYSFNDFLNNETFSDIKIYVDDKKYFAHKLILSKRSPVFARMFSNNMSETMTGNLKIEDLESRVFYEVLRFMYTNEFDIENHFLKEILIAAEKYDIEDLKSICENILTNTLNTINCITMVQFAENHNAKGLKQFCFCYIITRLAERVDLHEPLIELSESLPHLVLEMLKIMYKFSGYEYKGLLTYNDVWKIIEK